MTNKRKFLLLAVKLAVAALLLGWVFSQVHWRDYVLAAADGKSYSVVKVLPEDGNPAEFLVERGYFAAGASRSFTLSQLEPIPGGEDVIRKGFASSLGGLRLPILFVAGLGFGGALLLMALRWWFLLRVLDIHIRIWEIIRLTFLGQFFNTVVPGTVGGDVVKAYYVAKHTPKKAAVLVSIFMDRVLGLTEMTLLAGVMLGVVFTGALVSGDAADMEKVQLPALTLAVVLVLIVSAFVFLFSSRLRSLLRLEKLYKRLPIAHHFDAAGEAASLYRSRIGVLAKAVLITFGGHILWIGSLGVVGLGVGLNTAWYNFFLYIPLIYIIGAVPLTPGGVGLIEKLYVVFFTTPVCSPSEIMVLALLARLIPIFWGLPGIVVAITGPRIPGAEAMEAELGIEKGAAEANAAAGATGA